MEGKVAGSPLPLFTTIFRFVVWLDDSPHTIPFIHHQTITSLFILLSLLLCLASVAEDAFHDVTQSCAHVMPKQTISRIKETLVLASSTTVLN